MKRLSDHTPFTLSLLVLALVVLAWAVGLLGGSGTDRARAADLQPFGSCEELRSYLHDHRWAEGYGGYPYVLEDVAVDGAEALAAPTSRDSAAGAVGSNEAGTNVQEAGIDEPDIAKLDGETLLTIRRGEPHRDRRLGRLPDAARLRPAGPGGGGGEAPRRG